MRSWYAIRARDEGAEVSIYDEIGAYGVSAKAFIAELGALPDDAPLTLRLNSPGGSVFDAVAIYNALKRHAGPVAVWIDGIAASAASYVAMAGDEVVMPANAFIMIHDPAGMVLGTAADMRAMADALDKIKGSLVAGYAAKSGRDEAEIAALMLKETWFDAEEAAALGLADRVAEPVRIAAQLRHRAVPQCAAGARRGDGRRRRTMRTTARPKTRPRRRRRRRKQTKPRMTAPARTRNRPRRTRSQPTPIHLRRSPAPTSRTPPPFAPRPWRMPGR